MSMHTTISLKKIGFIGLGLIGGSIAKAIRLYYPDCELIAFDKNKETLALAIAEGTIHTSCSSIDDNFKHCDYIFLCAPISYNTAYLSQLEKYMDRNCILTDVGSVKTSIHQEVIALGMEEYFIGGHPMAGSEKSGFVNSKAHLIENAYYILTPSAKVSEEKVQAYCAFVESLKALPILSDYKTHDQITGTISHLPHIIASCLVNFVKDTDTEEELMKMLAAGGFKDITRIASSSPVMWQQICLKNKENIAKILEQYIEELKQAKTWIENGAEQKLYTMFESSRDYRNSVPNSSAGPIKKQFALYCDIVDEAGGIATIATILASNHISIKNIGIVHNREFEEGVLRIEFYDEGSSENAGRLLRKYRYIVYEI
ncbi:prephenate dehydrogenase [Mediterraneibacter sp. ICN-202921]|uniref:prephenate dehydrogenase n=2 Tax=Mediterraneibacter sp. ICN-202921 TaxID=3134657 RepID=UPI0030BF3EE9